MAGGTRRWTGPVTGLVNNSSQKDQGPDARGTPHKGLGSETRGTFPVNRQTPEKDISSRRTPRGRQQGKISEIDETRQFSNNHSFHVSDEKSWPKSIQELCSVL